MGRKRKVFEDNPCVSNGFSETTSNKQKLNAMMAMNVENNVPKITNGAPMNENSKAIDVVMRRRSDRLKSLGLESSIDLVENQEETPPYPERVNTLPVVSEEESEEEPQVPQDNALPKKNERSLEEKLDYIIRSVDEFKSKAGRNDFGRSNEGGAPELSYRSLYLDSQKKIEGFLEQNYDLVRKLEYSRGKIEAYEAMKDAVIAQKEVIYVSALRKATADGPSQPVQNPGSSHPPPAAIPGDLVQRKRKYTKKKC